VARTPIILPQALGENWSAPYPLADHPHLANAEIRAVFTALDLGIRALDPNVYQEVLKVYIAYKCETNFVDIIPQAKRLLLALNMPYAELDDKHYQALLHMLSVLSTAQLRQVGTVDRSCRKFCC
jgi:hypothetical protein